MAGTRLSTWCRGETFFVSVRCWRRSSSKENNRLFSSIVNARRCRKSLFHSERPYTSQVEIILLLEFYSYRSYEESVLLHIQHKNPFTPKWPHPSGGIFSLHRKFGHLGMIVTPRLEPFIALKGPFTPNWIPLKRKSVATNITEFEVFCVIGLTNSQHLIAKSMPRDKKGRLWSGWTLLQWLRLMDSWVLDLGVPYVADFLICE